MIIKDNFSLSYDLSGNVIITIPKSYLQHTAYEVLLKSVVKMIDSAIKDMNNSADWDGDSAADVAGICESDINDGAVHHDRDIYGL